MPDTYSNPETAQSIALAAIGWIVSDSRRAARFLDLTGLDPDQLRARLEEPALQQAAIDFLMANEGDLVACAADIGISASDIAGTAGSLR